ncbi:hypothetical protein T484DRAFT_1933304 [Baffinella frigidus]|nr:hypothetical protein T484DRAFT_1933304 [Cryptophyta sp. CCMP2293]
MLLWVAAAGALAVGRGIFLMYKFRPAPDYTAFEKIKLGAGVLRVPLSRTMDLCHEPAGLLMARGVTMGLGKALVSVVMSMMNRVEVCEDDRWSFFINTVRARDKDTPLITVSNHESCLDDPGLMGAIVPWDVACDPRRMRWGLITQDLGFPLPEKLPLPAAIKPTAAYLFHAITGGGQALPIWRGGGLDQPLLLDVCRRLAAGSWVHVFPEGRVVQNPVAQTLGLDPVTPRNPKEIEEKGRLKWGIGKLVAHSPRVPVIIPIHHKGMHLVYPNRNEWVPDGKGGTRFDNAIKHPLPRSGQKVSVLVGQPVEVEDLLIAHESLHGPLWKVSSGAASQSRWRSAPEERALYSAIARRVQEALLKLEREHNPNRGGSEPIDPRDPRAVIRDDTPEKKGGGWWS